MDIERTAACIKGNNKFLITAHISLEGDAIGSELAFYKLLKAKGKQAAIINNDNFPQEYNFLPGAWNIKKLDNSLKGTKFDCLVVLDCADLARCGEVYKMNISCKPVLNIDHHISNKMFGDINWVDPGASSCAEMIYRLYKRLRIPFTREAAMPLYVGMLTDTGSFHYPNTTGSTHKAIADLLRYNLNVPQIYKSVYENIPSADMKLIAKILPTLSLHARGRIACYLLKRDMLRKQDKASFDISEYILGCARAIRNVEVAVLLKESSSNKNEVRVNLRSQGKVDVNAIASFFGGGGHPTASGCTIKGRIEKIRTMVLKKIGESL